MLMLPVSGFSDRTTHPEGRSSAVYDKCFTYCGSILSYGHELFFEHIFLRSLFVHLCTYE